MDSNDVFFSLHAVALTLVVMVQCFLYEVRDESGAYPTGGCLGQCLPPPLATHTFHFTEDTETQQLLTGLIDLALRWIQGTPVMSPSPQAPWPGVRDTERQ